jgi:hypothetical protein
LFLLVVVTLAAVVAVVALREGVTAAEAGGLLAAVMTGAGALAYRLNR